MKLKLLMRRFGFYIFAGIILSAGHLDADDFDATTATVGRTANGLETPVNQLVTPAGIQVDLPRVRPNAIALSPDKKILVTSGLTHELIVVDPATGNILQHVPFPVDKTQEEKPMVAGILNPDGKTELSFTGLTFSPDGSRIYLSNVNGDIKVFAVDKNDEVSPLLSLALSAVKAFDRTNEIPAGIAVSADGKKIYVAGNLSNRLFELDAASGKILRTWNVGVAPFDIVLARNKIYVSNWGGRQPEADSMVGPAGEGTKVRVDERSIASEGSVSVIDLNSELRTPNSELLTGLHACALALAPGGKFLVCANAGSDTLSVIDTRTDKIVETVCTRQNAADLFGAQPNALVFDKSGKTLYVCNGTQNAVAVFQFKTTRKFLGLIPISRFEPDEIKMLGLIPVGWFPDGIAFDAKRKEICVANIKNIGDKMQYAKWKLGNGFGFNTRQFSGSLSLVPVPVKSDLQKFTQNALDDLRYPLLAQAKLPPRPNQPAVPVPERVGEPSVFSHVIYIIKENRTYDQVLGDVREGNGNADLCVFGERVTPNEHNLVRDFCLLDNTYCCSILSADGHQWADTGIATDYVEREFAGWPRSYPAGGFGEEGRDALAYSPAGFIWNDALAHGKTVADFGEFTSPTCHWKNSGSTNIIFLDAYHDFMGGSNEIAYSSEPDIEALRPYIMTNTIGWDLDVPDVWRAAQFIKDLKQFEAADNLPNLVILWLPNDHTSATRFGSPTPEAQVADNDLAMGKVFDAVSHSKFWTNTCIFAIEDDPQNGWDHVSGYRTTAYVASPYTKRGTTIHTQFNQTSLLRTMELMLGLPPMNQMDATATPMFDCFTNTPDFTAFDAVTNQVPLDEMNPPAKEIKDAQLRKDAMVSAKLPLDKEDECPEDLFNRILWREAKGPQVPYPNWAVKAVDDDD
jgi:DNA-binding beta-propeller fold protein YncE